MKNNKLIVTMIGISTLLFVISIIILLNTDSFSFNKKIDKSENNSNNVLDKVNEDYVDSSNNSVDQDNKNNSPVINSDNKNNNDTIQNTDTIKKNDNNTSDNTNKSDNNVSNSVDNKNSGDLVTSDIKENKSDIVSYFAEQEKSISNVANQDDRSLREKAKETFVTIVDFIFYDKEVNGYKFSQLTTSAKLQVIKIALSIDNKIDNYFPDYKDVIKDKYDNIKGKLAVKYLEFTSYLCESVGDDTCNQAKNDFNTMKESFGFTWQLVKELAASGSSKVKNFYESWRDL